MLGQRKTQTSSCNADRMTIRNKKQAQVFIYHETYETETLKLTQTGTYAQMESLWVPIIKSCRSTALWPW